MNKILIIGAASAIAAQTATMFAMNNAELFLVDISNDRLIALQADLKTRFNCKVNVFAMDVNDFEKHPIMFQNAVDSMNGLDAVLIAHGTLPDQQKVQENHESALKEFTTNGSSIISIATIAANYLEKQKSGCLAVISSVAGDRGRQSNYLYGSAKSAVTAFFSGLRGRLALSNVSVVTVKPGFVDTPMTAHLKKNFLFASPAKVGKVIYFSMLKGKNVVYVPKYWKFIMLIVKSIPESIFKKLKI